MHRTTTTAALLVTLAVAGLSGCTTVQRPRPPAAPPATAPGRAAPPVSRPEGGTERQIVQAPAREALERVGPSRRVEPEAAAPRRSAGPRRAAPGRPGPARAEPGHRHSSGSGHRQRPPLDGMPDVPESVRREIRQNTDVCSLGRKYGHWRADSPEAVVCEETLRR
ncbi:hypothetical protein ACL02U_15845 [Streptomyces sp. MS06]|uniref:hypothetical protein n=1 Tax=Streptomyces sp. MS06 TaxID=3385974 RepID=UPI00399F4D00